MSDLQRRLDAIPAGDNWAIAAANLLLEHAHAAGCSDLHLIQSTAGLSARGRRDDFLVEIAAIVRPRSETLIARFKVLSRLPAYVRHEPQEGRIEWSSNGTGPQILRASFLPTTHGQNLVVRFPREAVVLASLEELAVPQPQRDCIERLLLQKEGAIILTGPSGSGKTTTIHAMLARLHERHGDRLHFLTIEDPVERELAFASQVQVDEPRGVTFDRALRAALRHDPDVIMIGEVRDTDTARTAIQAAMTGHLVLTTLHAGRAARVFPRLLAMGIEPYMVASAVNGVVAQRLVRRLCPECRGNASSCTVCSGTGISGRIALFEALAVTEPLRELILAGRGSGELINAAVAAQAGELVAEGNRLVAEGVISRAECDYALSGQE